DRNAVNIETSQPRLQGKCWPNPFVQTTNIPLRLSTAEAVSVTVHDLDGKRLATLLEGELAAGSHTLPWHVDGSLPAGTYLVRIAIGETVRTERVVHLGL
ncbi:MAG TPA: T9SS type A sorting domain-containing protein, partial [Bacteroidia bacterium]|nr:T9SS type A sorting domain-containing protein [Bacteroidia bacterium]